MKIPEAPVTEIFASIQGEGLYAGQKQVFLRFAGCNLSCSYCDEPAARGGAGAAVMSAAAAAASVIKLARAKSTRAVSLTGGEPLLQWRFIRTLAPLLKKAGLAVHLETNGVLHRELSKVCGLCDVIAADIKLPSSTGQKAFWAEHKKFLAAAPGKIFVKTVVTSATKMSDLAKAIDVAASVRPGMPFFIQPATARRGKVKPPSEKFVREACCLAALKLRRVKLLPQQHPIWGVK